MIIACRFCGVAFDLDHVPATPGKKCPGCKAPLDTVAVEGMTFEADNPADPQDPARARARAQAMQDVATVNSDHAAAVTARTTPA